MLKIISLNLNGIRSACNKNFLNWLAMSQADIVCVQELKAHESDMTAEMLAPQGYYGHFHYAQQKGYSGVGIYSKIAPQQVIHKTGFSYLDEEGRWLVAHFETLTIVSLYLPSGSSGMERQTIKFATMDKLTTLLDELVRDNKEVIVCGDWNIAHHKEDLKNWRGNLKNSGFLPEERAWLSQLLDQHRWVDVYRQLYPHTTDTCYTWWSNRGQAWNKNVGWRIDYQIATHSIAQSAISAEIYKTHRFSDHAPLVISYDAKW